jgi:adenine-specific DNA methylase
VLAKYVRAKRWCRDPYETVSTQGRRLRRVPTAPERVAAEPVQHADELGASGRALLQRASLRPGDLPDASVDLVLTDPPYFGNVQYAELMDFCYAWLRRLTPDTGFFDATHAKTDADAVGSVRTLGLVAFAEWLSVIYRAGAQALKPGSAFAFTYHHNDLDAYAPLIVACLDAGLVPTKVFACPSEMRASTHIFGRNAATTDAVFVLRKPPLPKAVVEVEPDLNPARFVSRRVSALQRAGLSVSAADRACLGHAALAVRAMARLREGWDSEQPLDERFSAAAAALGVAAPVAAGC